MNSIVYHLIIERYSTKTLHWYFPWATALHLYNMTGRGEKLQQLHCYHPFSDSLDIYLTKNHYENYSPKMVRIAKIWGPGSWTNNRYYERLNESDTSYSTQSLSLKIVKNYEGVLCLHKSTNKIGIIIHSVKLTTDHVLAVTCFGLKINGLPSCIARDIFKALFVDDLAICFRGRSLDTIERHLQQAVNAIQEWATRNGFRFAAHKCKVIHFTAPRSRAQRPHTFASGGVHKVPWAVVGLAPLI